jgi:hypothetical protein
MDYELVLRALRRHVETTQKAVTFFRDKRMGVNFAIAMKSLEEAVRALEHVEKEQRKSQLH